MQSPIPIFDGHNDVLLRLFNKREPQVEHRFLDGEADGQLDFPRGIKGGFAGGLFPATRAARAPIATALRQM